MKRTVRLKAKQRLRRQSKKNRTGVTPAWRQKKAELRDRSGGQCEVRLSHREIGELWQRSERDAFRFAEPRLHEPERWRCLVAARDAHHVVKRSQGRDDRLENLLHVCRRCHEWFDKAGESKSGRLVARPAEGGGTPTCSIQRVSKFQARGADGLGTH